MVPPTRARGFTLVELLVSMGLMLVISGVMIYGFNASQRTSTRALGLLDIQVPLNAALALLDRDVTNALLYDPNAPVWTANTGGSTDGYGLKITAAGDRLTDAGIPVTATPKHRLFFRYYRNDDDTDPHTGRPSSVKIRRCELVMLTTLPTDPDGDGRDNRADTAVWVRWVAERVKVATHNNPASYRLRLTRQLPRFVGNDFHEAERYPARKDLIEAPPTMRSREIAGADNAADTAAPDNLWGYTDTHFDPDRFFGPPQVMYYAPETVVLADSKAPVWNLFILSDETTDLVDHPAGDSTDEPFREFDVWSMSDSDSNLVGWNSGANAWAKWERPVGVHLDLEAYAPNGVDQRARVTRTVAFPSPPVTP